MAKLQCEFAEYMGNDFWDEIVRDSEARLTNHLPFALEAIEDLFGHVHIAGQPGAMGQGDAVEVVAALLVAACLLFEFERGFLGPGRLLKPC